MIENYKGWDITLNWGNKDYLERDTTKNNFFNQKEKWIGVHLNGEKIFQDDELRIYKFNNGKKVYL